MTRRARLTMTCLLAAMVALAACGCASATTSGKDADSARACVQTAMQDVADLSPDARQTVLEELDEQAGKKLDKMGVSADDLIDDFFRDFSFEVGEASVTGNSAQVKVNVTCRPVRDIVVKLVEQAHGKWESAGPILWELLDGSEPQTVELSVSCKKDSDGIWSCDDGLKKALTDLCLK